ncbi:Helix-turn-helix domain-containing protein [Paraburkholderia fungorum]|uniref:helix-turn-helix domain-containing protein n=1 Tax=Paraburkholderia fungorum TaxID=134537 RepID=UPI000D05CAC1|nr:helix-turn-helix domain-containing protein [Paraburkholderia fungorum]PRZ51205.1 Helix-turn-helix domain-containing protein [Paraburkholderia fungorum]
MKSYTWRHAIINSPLPGQTRHVLLTLSCHVNDAGESAYPSVKTLAREADVSEPTVVKHLRIAKLAGWLIVRKHGYGGQKWARNEYLPAIPEGFEIPDWTAEGTKAGLVPSNSGLSTEELNEIKRLETEGAKAGLVPSGEALNGATEGTKPDAIKALNQLKSNYSEELPVNYPSTGAKENQAEGEEKAGEQNQTEPASRFERFWEVWPSHSGRKTGGRPDCAKHWAENNLEKDAELIIAHVQAMARTKKWIDGYDPRPLRYLEERWWLEGAPSPTPAPAEAESTVTEWWLDGPATEAHGPAIGMRAKHPEEPLPHYRVLVAKTAGKGPWIDYVLKHAAKSGSQKFYEWVRAELGEALLPADDYAS